MSRNEARNRKKERDCSHATEQTTKKTTTGTKGTTAKTTASGGGTQAPETAQREVNAEIGGFTKTMRKAAAQGASGERFDFRKPIGDVLDAIDRCGSFTARVAVNYSRTRRAQTPALMRLASERVAARGATGAETQRAAAAELERLYGELKSKVGADVEADATRLGSALADAMMALDNSLAKARMQLRLPPSMRNGDGLGAVMARIERRNEIRFQILRDADGFARLYGDARRLDPATADELRGLARLVLEELVYGGPMVREVKARGGVREVASAKEAAMCLLEIFDADERANQPPELAEAQAIRDRLEVAFVKLVGYDWSISGGRPAGEFRSALASGDLTKSPLRVDPAWPVRYMPPTKAPLNTF